MPEPVSLSAGFFSLIIFLASMQSLVGVKNALALSKPLVDIPKGNIQPPSPPEIIPIHLNQFSIPSLSARSYIVQDVNTGQVLLEKSSNTPQLPASTTKIMTALVALEEFALDEVITIDRAREATGHTAQLIAGEKLTVHNVLKALLISSGNDAAVALALHHKDGYEGYVSLMNQKAEQLNLKNTHFTNVSGIETSNHHVSAKDLAKLTAFALKNDVFKSIVSIPQTTISSTDGKNRHTLVNTNALLTRVEGVEGVKTGWTPNAKECLVTYTNRQGNQIIVVVLGSDDRFGESEALIEWAYANYLWERSDQ